MMGLLFRKLCIFIKNKIKTLIIPIIPSVWTRLDSDLCKIELSYTYIGLCGATIHSYFFTVLIQIYLVNMAVIGWEKLASVRRKGKRCGIGKKITLKEVRAMPHIPKG